MKKTAQQKEQKTREPIPFDDALRAMLVAPPSPHKPKAAPKKKKADK